MDNIVDNIGLPYSGINMAYSNTGTIGPEDADVLISLKEGHSPTADYVKELRTVLPQKFTGTTFAFLPPDIVSQVLNFGLPAPIDVQVVGPDEKASYAYATDLLKRVRMVPGIADLRIQQAFDYPQLNVDVNRSLAGIVGLTQQDVANSLLVTLSGSGQVKPNFWLNTNNGVSYPIVVQIPQYWMSSVSDLVNLPITSFATKTPQLLGGLARITPGPSAAVVSHYDVQPVIDIYGAVQGRDLGAVARDVARVLKEAATSAPRGTHVGDAGPGSDDDQRLFPALFRACGCNCTCLSGHRCQFPILARSVHHHHGPARGSRRHRLDAVHNGHDPFHPGPDWCYHVHGDHDCE
jgi:multidrug efflux pump subunit AcrB